MCNALADASSHFCNTHINDSMKYSRGTNSIIKSAGIAFLALTMLSACKKDDNKVEPEVVVDTEVKKSTYTLNVKDAIGVRGTVTFSEKSAGSSESVVTISLVGTPSGTHPAHIHLNSAVETGGIAYMLSSVDSSGKSTTTLPVSFSTLKEYDGYVNVHLDASLATIIAQGDIGGNVLTGDTKSYNISPDSASGIFGKVIFAKRRNNNTLVTVDLTTGGILPSGTYPAHINLGSVSTVGLPYKKKTLNTVDHATRKSETNIRRLDDSTVITYANWLVYDGFITIRDAADQNNIVAIGNIGAN